MRHNDEKRRLQEYDAQVREAIIWTFPTRTLDDCTQFLYDGWWASVDSLFKRRSRNNPEHPVMHPDTIHEVRMAWLEAHHVGPLSPW